MIPSLQALPARPKRIILHWTAGGPQPNAVDRQSYHYLISQDGRAFPGVDVAANMRTVSSAKPYAAHTRGWNSYSVGVAFCGMHRAMPSNFGPHPITRDQVMIGCYFVGKLCREWDLPVRPHTVFTHSEADWRHGMKQTGKWDIDVLPWAPQLSRTEVADSLRRWVQAAVDMQIADVDLKPVRPTPRRLDL